MTTKPKLKQPEIFYEDPDASHSEFPFIQTQKDEKMPSLLWVFDYHDSGEFEPDLKGNPVAIVDQIPHTYCNLQVLKEKLRPELFDEVRGAFGLMPLKESAKLGQEKLDKIFANVEKMKEDIKQKPNNNKDEEK